MKYIYKLGVYITLSTIAFACVDDELVKDTSNPSGNFNIESFSEGYSVAFDVSLDPMNGDSYTRAEDITDLEIEEWENHLDAQEFRVLFFDSKDRFLFESRSRWFTQIETGNGSGKWRVGIPIFQYLSDNYDPNISEREDYWMDDSYNWERIIEIMKSEPFKIAIMANRPSSITIPSISDWNTAIKDKNFGKNGPFWGPKNSVASYNDPDHVEDGMIKRVFDLHHTQFDPIYYSKSTGNGGGWIYDFIMDFWEDETEDGSKAVLPHMGAVSSWLNSKRYRTISTSSNNFWFYRLPKDRSQGVLSATEKSQNSCNEFFPNFVDEVQYIPMYGIQRFEPLKTWVQGTTYNLSQQTGSQTGDYTYKGISLLRSVVKLELRIPMYEEMNNGTLQKVIVNNKWAQILGNNFMARCEPMDVWSPTDSIWSNSHERDCEWLRIKEYGLYAIDDGNTFGDDYRKRLSWFYGAWKEQGWKYLQTQGNLTGPSLTPVTETPTTSYPRIFNPITQRLTCSFITDCYLPIIPDNTGIDTDGDGWLDPKPSKRNYHRWVVYCGEKNINDPNTLNDIYSQGIMNYFRIEITRNNTNTKVYNFPILDYSKKDNNPFFEKESYMIDSKGITNLGYNSDLWSSTKTDNEKYDYKLKRLYKNDNIKNYKDYFPYPLLRNHHYRLTVSFKDGDDINVMIENGEQRTVGDILFK